MLDSDISSNPHILPGKHFKQRGMVLPFQPLSMAFSNINYYVDVPLVCNITILFIL